MLRMMFMVGVVLAALFGQQESSRRAEGQRHEKEKKERKHQVYRNFLGTDTFTVEYCMPGRVEKGFKGQTKAVPCGCVGMYQNYWEKQARACDMQTEFRSAAWKDCHSSIEGCVEFLRHGGSSDLYGKDNMLRCQSYCYESHSCKCCDSGVAMRRQQVWHRLTLAGMIALKPGLRILKRSEACNEWVVFSYNPTQPADLFYGLASQLLYGD